MVQITNVLVLVCCLVFDRKVMHASAQKYIRKLKGEEKQMKGNIMATATKKFEREGCIQNHCGK